jgi:hypothetical protein
MDLTDIIERVGDTEVLSSEDETDAGFTARDALRDLSPEGRIRVLSWVASAWDIPLAVAAREPADGPALR